MSQIFEVPKFKNDWLASGSKISPKIWYKYFYKKPQSIDESFKTIQLPRVKNNFQYLNLID